MIEIRLEEFFFKLSIHIIMKYLIPHFELNSKGLKEISALRNQYIYIYNIQIIM